MKFSTIAAASLLVASATAAPALTKRQEADIDGVILNYALTLEHLEAVFYKEGLEKYSASAFSDAGYPDWVRKRVSEIGSHEAAHVDFLTTAITGAGLNATAACTYSFPHKSPASFLALAQILEGVGVAAYLGAAAKITNPDYLTAAGSVLTVEARHAAWIASAANKGDGFPAAFDAYLGFNEVYSLAASFIKSCPESNPALPVMAFPALNITTKAPYSPGQTVKFAAANATDSSFLQFIGAGGAKPVAYSSNGVKVPEGLAGQVYVLLTSDNATATDSNTLAGPAILPIELSAKTYELRM